MRRLLLVPVLAVGMLAVAVSPAAADPAGPTHYDSVITAVDGPSSVVERVEVEVLGGDAFLAVHAAPGTAVEVPGYEGEPYVRIDADGSVFVNERSESRYLNDARYGEADVDVPALADNDAPPSWAQEAQRGSYAWHDHRIHFMSPTLPRQVDPSASERQVVWDWTVPLVVDGEPVQIAGELSWVPGPPPAVPVALVLGFVLAAGAVVWRWRVAALVPLQAAMIAVTGAVGAAKMVGLPPGADGEPALLVLPAIAFAALAAGLVLSVRRPAAGMLVPGAGIPILVWGIVQAGALTRPIVPGPIPVEVIRIVVAAALAVGVASILAGARHVAAATAIDADGLDDAAADRASSGA